MNKIIVEKPTTISLLNRACRFTSGKKARLSLLEMYRCEHSPIRTQIFAIYMYGIKSFVSVHFVRHKIGVEHFVESNRDDKTDIIADRNTPVNHMMICNAQSLINMARKRLCHKAHPETIEVMELIKNDLFKVDPDLASILVPECQYRGKCYELKPCGKRKE